MKSFFQNLNLKRFVAYAAVGCIDTALDWAAFTLAHSALLLGATRSQAIGYLVGAVSSYFLNGRITFRDGHGRRWAQFFKFALWNAFSLALSAGLIWLLTTWGMNAYFAKVILTLEVALANYIGYKYLVFRVKELDMHMHHFEKEEDHP